MKFFRIHSTFWKIWLLSLLLTALVWFLTGRSEKNIAASRITNGSIESRARTISSEIENRLVARHISQLSNIEELLEFNATQPDQILSQWLQENPDVISLILWKIAASDTLRLTQKWLYANPKVLSLSAAERQRLFAYILQPQTRPLNSSQPYVIGSILPPSFLDYPIIPFAIPLENQWLRAVEMKMRIIDWDPIFAGQAGEGEYVALMDSGGDIVFASEDVFSDGFSWPENSVIRDKHEAAFRKSLTLFPWHILYKRSLPSAGIVITNIAAGTRGLLLILLSTAVSLFLTLWVTRPVKKLAKTASVIARGNFRHSIPLVQNEEMNRLIRLFNYMGEEMSRMNKLDVSEIISEKNKTEAILRNIADAVVVTDLDDRILVVNYIAEKWFGISDGEVRSTPVKEAIGNEALIDLISLVKQEKHRGSIDFSMNSPLTGESKVFQAHAARIVNVDNNLVGVVTVIRDVTKETEANQVKTELVSMVAHELKSPLTSIYGFSELLLEDDLEPNKIHEYATVILNESTRLTDLVNKFLDLSRLESGRTEIRMIPFDMGQIVEKILDTYHGQADKKRIKVITDIPNLPPALGDPDMIEQVILNLYSNAIKYSPENSKVGIEAKEEQNELVISVIDNGYGIPKESLPYIFDKFYRVVDTENETDVEGSGLGLALAREIIERHGGKMTVNSRLGVGSVFSFTVPIGDREQI